MNVSLDYDSTYTKDPVLWDGVVAAMRARGHKVYLVTMRYNGHEAEVVKRALDNKVDAMYFTGRKGKRTFMYDQGIHIDVWIDDQPDFIIMDASG
jgi:hypothetical protein